MLDLFSYIIYSCRKPIQYYTKIADFNLHNYTLPPQICNNQREKKNEKLLYFSGGILSIHIYVNMKIILYNLENKDVFGRLEFTSTICVCVTCTVFDIKSTKTVCLFFFCVVLVLTIKQAHRVVVR